MKNNYYNERCKAGWLILLVCFFGLFANEAMAQDTFNWTGATNNDWATASNWSKVGSANPDTFPGETVATDLVVVGNGGTPIIASPATYGLAKLTISNFSGGDAGSLLTINSGVTVNVTSATFEVVVLRGGSIVNNGVLNLKSTATAASRGFDCSTPAVLPAGSQTYGYSGDGTLTIDIEASTTNNSAAILNQSANTNSTYQFLLKSSATTFKLSLNAATVTYAFRSQVPAGANVSKLIIGGTGVKLGTTLAPIWAGLFAVLPANKVEVNAGTTLELNSKAGMLVNLMVLANNSIGNPTTFTNNGTINLLGETSRNGIAVSLTSPAALDDIKLNIVNNGILNVDIVASSITVRTPTPAVSYSAFNVGYTTNVTNTNAIVTITNSGNLSFINRSYIAATGFGVWTTSAGQGAIVKFVNSGTLNVSGTIPHSYGRMEVDNTGTFNSRGPLTPTRGISNSVTGIINFLDSTANFAVLAPAAATVGAVYKDANNNEFTILATKVTTVGTRLYASINFISPSGIPASGDLTLLSGTGDAIIAFTGNGVMGNAISLATSAMDSVNNGTVNTGTKVGNANNILGISDASTGVIAPGGSSYGVAIYNRTAATTGEAIPPVLNGTLRIQAGGNSAGFTYDRLSNIVASQGFTLGASSVLDVTGIYTPVAPTSLDILTTNAGAITGTFATVIGITNGWSVDYSDTTKVKLVYAAVSPTADLWTGGTSTAWTDASNWSAGVPNQNSDVTIGTGTFQPTITTNVNVNSLTVNSGSTVIANGPNLTVTGAVVNNGTMTLASNSNLIQGGTTNTNSGDITVNRNSNALSRFDYTLWSSPVAGAQTLTGFSPLTTLSPIRFYNYNETTNLYNEVATPASTTFASAQGYLIRMPDTAVTAPATQTFVGAFTGVPNNGTINKAVTYNGATFGYNALGNPYPSTIDAQAFIAANTANIESALYFWRKINQAAGSAYAVYNPMGSTIATLSSALPNGTIQVGQGFFVKAKSGATTVNFTNAMRVANNGNQFFKTKQVAAKDRVWLNLTNVDGAFSQSLIGYTATATTAVDMFDAKYIDDSPIALTSRIANEEYTIQGRPTFDATDVVSLSFKTDVDGAYSIALGQFDGVFATGQNVYLVDNKTGSETDLKNGAYNFTAKAGVDANRFTLKYQKTLKVDAPAFNENSVNVYSDNGVLYVKSANVAISNIKVFDVQGRLLAEQNNVKANSAIISNLKASKQVLIVKIAGEDNNVVAKKVIN